MSQYTTGELAKLAQVSVRTIQYYDQKKLLQPTALSDGGRRLYTEDDLDRLKLILLFKQLGLALKSIQAVLASSEASQVLHLLLQTQSETLEAQLTTMQIQLKQVRELQRSLQDLPNLPIKSIIDIENIMTEQQGLQRIHWQLLIGGGLIDVFELVAIGYALWLQQWWPVWLGIPIVIISATILIYRYFKQVSYQCPHCQADFQPTWRQSFFARHTWKTRQLICPNCHERHFCVEQYRR